MWGSSRRVTVAKRIRDPDVRILAALAATLEPDYTDQDDPWADSPFGWIKRRPSRQVGAIAEKLVAGWLATRDFDVARSPDSQADRLVNGKRVEIKFSTQWASGGLKFQQIRDQNYDAILMLGLTPFDAQCWAIPKPVIMRKWGTAGGPQPQHGGQAGRDTAWLAFQADSPPNWMARYGGRLADAASSLERFCRAKS